MSYCSCGYCILILHFHRSERISTLYECAKMNTIELKQATQFLHEKGILLPHLPRDHVVIASSGILLHYDEGQLSDLYFVDPQWLCSMLAKVIAVPEVHSYHKNGMLYC